jgi:hypothetical protein
MKFFTVEYMQAAFESSKVARDTWADYQSHLENLRGQVPDSLLELALLPGVDDGLIVGTQTLMQGRLFILILRCGDFPEGYYDLVLKYRHVEIDDQDREKLLHLAKLHRQNIHGDLAYHEIAITEEGRIEHCFLFHENSYASLPYQEVTIRCRELHWEKVSRPNRDLPPTLNV